MSILAKEGDKGMYHPRGADSLTPAIVQRVLRGSLVDLLVGQPDEDKYEAVSIQVVEGAVESRQNQRYFVLGDAEFPSNDAPDDPNEPADGDDPVEEESEPEDDAVAA